MADPYRPPEDELSIPGKASKGSRFGPVDGCAIGGCLFPLVGFLASYFFLGGPGGPLNWVILSIILGTLGLILGFIFKTPNE